jgi:hypothetical protein
MILTEFGRSDRSSARRSFRSCLETGGQPERDLDRPERHRLSPGAPVLALDPYADDLCGNVTGALQPLECAPF